MRYCLLAALLSATAHLLPAQRVWPGGVPGAVCWLEAAQMPDGSTALVNRLDTALSAFAMPTSGALLNFNPAPSFTGSEKCIKIDFMGQKNNGLTAFTVLRPTKTSDEKNVWSLTKGDTAQHVLTDRRMGNLAEAHYMNFIGTRMDIPGIRTYFRGDGRGSKQLQRMNIRIGTPARHPALPVVPFKGVLPEIILYDRQLAHNARIKIESYLALKYGLTLSESDYLNSKGQVIWKQTDNKDFGHRITGIGRDDSSGLCQKQSTCSYEPGMLVLGADTIVATNGKNKSFVPDQSFLIWSDNGGALAPAPKTPGRAQHVARFWKIDAVGQANKIKSCVQFDTKKLPLPPSGFGWHLLIDRSGTGCFSTGQTIYIKPVSEKNTLAFEHIVWDADGSGSDIFTLVLLPELYAHFTIEQPHCFPKKGGTLHSEVIGGKPPYTFELQDDKDGQALQWRDELSKQFIVPDLMPGDYQLRLYDAEGHAFVDTFYVQSADAPRIGLPTEYWIKDAEPLLIDAEQGKAPSGISYQWSGPNAYLVEGPQVLISEKGHYQLNMDSAGCKARHEFMVHPFWEDNFESVILSPNPAPQGVFNLQVKLRRTADMELNILDELGRVIDSRIYRGDQNYQYTGGLPIPGAYSVVLISDNTTHALSVIGME
jgi:hypothetical protein